MPLVDALRSDDGSKLIQDFKLATLDLMRAFLSEEWNNGKGGPNITEFLRVQTEAQSLLTKFGETIGSTDVTYNVMSWASRSLIGWMAVCGLLPSSSIPSSGTNTAVGGISLPQGQHLASAAAFTEFVVPEPRRGGPAEEDTEVQETTEILAVWEHETLKPVPSKKRDRVEGGGEGRGDPTDVKRPKQ